MKTIAKILALLLALGLPCSASAQTTTTVGGLTTATSGNFTATSSMLVNISGTDYQFVPNTLARVVLSNLTVTNSGSVFTLTGIISTTPSLSGVLTLTQNTTGVLTLSNGAVGNSSPTNAVAWLVNTTLSNREGIRVVTTTGQTSEPLAVYSVTTGTYLSGITIDGAIQALNSNPRKFVLGDASSNSYILANSTTLTTYFQAIRGAGIGFAISGSGTPNVALVSPTAGILAVTNTASTLGQIQTGGFASGYRAFAASASMTLTDSIVNITASGITVTLADSTSLTGRHSIFINSSAGTSTVAGLTATQTINGATTLSVPANSSLRVISTGTINLSY